MLIPCVSPTCQHSTREWVFRSTKTLFFSFKGADIVLHGDVLSRVVPYIDTKKLPALARASKTTRDAAVSETYQRVASRSCQRWSVPSSKNCYNAYFQDHFGLSIRPEVCPHQKWEAWFAALGDIGTLKGKLPNGVTLGVLRLLKNGNRAQFEALAKLCGEEEGFNVAAMLLEARKRSQKLLEKAYDAGKVSAEDMLDGALALGQAYIWMSKWDQSMPCFVRAKQGFARLLGEDRRGTSPLPLAPPFLTS